MDVFWGHENPSVAQFFDQSGLDLCDDATATPILYRRDRGSLSSHLGLSVCPRSFGVI